MSISKMEKLTAQLMLSNAHQRNLKAIPADKGTEAEISAQLQAVWQKSRELKKAAAAQGKTGLLDAERVEAQAMEDHYMYLLGFYAKQGYSIDDNNANAAPIVKRVA